MDKISLVSNKFLVIYLVLAFTLISLFGLWNHYNMEMDSTGAVNTCNFVSQPACSMSVTKHVAMWQSFFTSPDISYLTFLFLLTIFIIVYFTTTKILKEILKICQYLKYFCVSLVNYLTQAFSQGILNPKVY